MNGRPDAGGTSIAERVKAIIADQLMVDPDEIRPDSDFVEDLGADELDVVELVMEMEDEFGIEISDEELVMSIDRDKGGLWGTRESERSDEGSGILGPRVRTVGGFTALIESLVRGRG